MNKERDNLRFYLGILIMLITSLGITGIGFIDDHLWDIIMAVLGMVVYAIVGFLFAAGFIRGKNAGKEAYVCVFLILLILGFYIYEGIIKLQEWVVSWPLIAKICVLSSLSLLIIAVAAILCVKVFKKGKINETT